MIPTSTPVAAGTPVSGWLLPTPDMAQIQLEKAVMQAADAEEPRARPLRMLSAVARRALVEEIEAKLGTILSETLGDLVVGGWRTHTAITQAARKSRHEPGVDQVVPLRNHTITADRHHDLDIEVDGVRVLTLTTRLVVRLQLYDAVAVVRDGRMVAVRSGQGRALGSVTVEGVELVQRALTFPLAAEFTAQANISS